MFGIINRIRRFRSTPDILFSPGTSGDGFNEPYDGRVTMALSDDNNTMAVIAVYSFKVYIFIRVSGMWTVQQTLSFTEEPYSVTLTNDGNTLVVGFPRKTIGGNLYQGELGVYKRSAGVWSLNATLVASGTYDGFAFAAAHRNLGYNVDISGDGNWIIAGAPAVTLSSAVPMVGLWNWNGSSYILHTAMATPADFDTRGNTRFGYSVSIDDTGSTALVGAPFWDTGTGSPNDDGGVVIWYTRSGSTWNTTISSINDRIWYLSNPSVGIGSTGFDSAGTSVALSADGNVAVVGIPRKNTNSGAIAVFHKVSGTFDFSTTKLEVGAASSYLGTCVSVNRDGSFIIASAPRRTINFNLQGEIRTYRYNKTNLTLLNSLTQEIALNFMGYSVLISNDGIYILSSTDFEKVLFFYRR